MSEKCHTYNDYSCDVSVHFYIQCNDVFTNGVVVHGLQAETEWIKSLFCFCTAV